MLLMNKIRAINNPIHFYACLKKARAVFAMVVIASTYITSASVSAWCSPLRIVFSKTVPTGHRCDDLPTEMRKRNSVASPLRATARNASVALKRDTVRSRLCVGGVDCAPC